MVLKAARWTRRVPSTSRDILLNDLGTFHTRLASTRCIVPPRLPLPSQCINRESRRSHQSQRKLRSSNSNGKQPAIPRPSQAHDGSDPSTQSPPQSPNNDVPTVSSLPRLFEDAQFEPYTAEEKQSLCAELSVTFLAGRPVRGLPIELGAEGLREMQKHAEQIKKSLGKWSEVTFTYAQTQYTPLQRKRVRRLMEIFYLDERDALFRRAAGDESAKNAKVSNQYLLEQIKVITSHIRALDQQRKPSGSSTGKGLPMNRYKATPNVRVDMAEMDEWKLLLSKHEALHKVVVLELPPRFRKGATFEELPDEELPEEHHRNNERFREDQDDIQFRRNLFIRTAQRIAGTIAVGALMIWGVRYLDGPPKPVPSRRDGQVVAPITSVDHEQQQFWSTSKIAAEERDRIEKGRGGT